MDRRRLERYLQSCDSLFLSSDAPITSSVSTRQLLQFLPELVEQCLREFVCVCVCVMPLPVSAIQCLDPQLVFESPTCACMNILFSG